MEDDAVAAGDGGTGKSAEVLAAAETGTAAPPVTVGPDASEAMVEGDSDDTPASPGDGPDDADTRDPLRFNNWMKRSATGAVMTGIAVGLQQALQLPRQEPAFVIEASGEPHDPNHPIDLHFDPDNPADTVAIIRRPVHADPPEEP